MQKLPIYLMLAGSSLASGLHAQTASDLNEGSQVNPTATPDTYIFSWWGKPSRFYIIEHSTDLRSPWSHIPAIEPGYDEVAQWGFATNASAFFIRLKYTEDALIGSFYGDDDSDGIINGVELLLGYSAITANGNADGDLLSDRAEIALGLDPDDNTDAVDGDADGIADAIEKIYGLSTSGTTDLDGDSMHDEWELLYHLNLEIDDSALDPDQDGLTHLEEFQEGTNPWAFDTDGDTIPDGLEVANAPDLNPLIAEPVHTRNNYAWKFTTDLTDRFSEFSDRISESPTHALALDKDGNVYAWGTNDFGQLAQGSGTAGTDLSAPTLTQFVTAKSVAAGIGTSHVVDAGGVAYGTGDNSRGAIGTGVVSGNVEAPQAVVGLNDVKRVHGQSEQITEAIAGNQQQIYAWGRLTSGNYVSFLYSPSSQPTPQGAYKSLQNVVSLSSSWNRSVNGPTSAITGSGDFYIWGDNDGYALTHNDILHRTSENQKLSVNAIEPVSYMSSKDSHAAAINENGNMWIWGHFNGYDDGADNQVQSVPSVLPHDAGIRAVAIVSADASNGEEFTAQKAGYFLNDEGHLYLFYWKIQSLDLSTFPARNEYGQLIVERVAHSQTFVAIAESYDGVLLLAADGELYKYSSYEAEYSYVRISSVNSSKVSAFGPVNDGTFTKITLPNAEFYDLVDTNSDGISDLHARFIGLHPDLADSNLDGVSDVVALTNGGDPTAWDNDGDTIPNAVEIARGLNPNAKDSDGDGMLDSEELYLADRLSNYILQSDANSQGPEINLAAPTNATAL